MSARILARMREQVRLRRYVMTTHAVDEMEDDGLNVFDVESVILTGGIVERQRDRDTHESKYVVRGRTLDGEPAAVVVKQGFGGRLVVVTVYAE